VLGSSPGCHKHGSLVEIEAPRESFYNNRNLFSKKAGEKLERKEKAL